MTDSRDMLVVGDAMVDAYLRTQPVGISDEAPVAVLDWVGVERTFGGMMNVAASCVACGGVRVMGVIGDDEAGRFLRYEAEAYGMEACWFSDGRPTSEKMRVLAGEQEAMLARIDVEEPRPIGAATAAELLHAVRDALPNCGALLVSDYAKGTITPGVAHDLLEAANQCGVPIIVDAKPESMNWFRGATLFTPNEREARQLAHARGIECDSIDALGNAIAKALDAAVLITRSGDGMTLFDRDGSRRSHFDAGTDRPRSTSGAGDVVVAAIGVELGRGRTLPEAVNAAAKAVARAVLREGTCRIEPSDL